MPTLAWLWRGQVVRFVAGTYGNYIASFWQRTSPGNADSEKWHPACKEHLGFAGGIIVAPVSTLPILALGQKLSTGPAPHW